MIYEVIEMAENDLATIAHDYKYIISYLRTLKNEESDNKYLIMWIGYFIRANGLQGLLKSKFQFNDPLVRSVYTSRNGIFKACKDFKLFSGVLTRAKNITMLEHLDVFKPQ